jgi:hypothetical protein
MRARASGADSQNLGGQIVVRLVVSSHHRQTTPPLRGTLVLPLSCTFLAERVGFEPTVSFPTHDFQSADACSWVIATSQKSCWSLIRRLGLSVGVRSCPRKLAPTLAPTSLAPESGLLKGRSDGFWSVRSRGLWGRAFACVKSCIASRARMRPRCRGGSRPVSGSSTLSDRSRSYLIGRYRI